METSGNTRLHNTLHKELLPGSLPQSRSLAGTYRVSSALCTLVHAVAGVMLNPGMAALFSGRLACPANAQPHAETLGAACTPAEHAIDC